MIMTVSRQQTSEAMQKAIHDAQFLREDLMFANRTCQPVESIVLLRLIAKATELQQEIKNLSNVMSQ